MIEVGRIAELSGGKAKISLPRKEGCAGCGKCAFAAGGKSMLLEVENAAGGRPGDEVEVEIPQRDPLTAALLLFGLPILGLLGGVFAGYALSGKMGWEPTIGGGVLGGLLVVAAFFFVRTYDRRSRQREYREVRILRIIIKKIPPNPPFTKGGIAQKSPPLTKRGIAKKPPPLTKGRITRKPPPFTKGGIARKSPPLTKGG